MRHLLAVFLAAGLAITGCATTGPAPNNPFPAAQTVTITDQAMAAAELAYNTPARMYLSAVRQGLLSPAERSAAREVLGKAHTALRGARAAFRAKNAATFGQRVNELQGFVSEAVKMIPPV